MKTWHTQKKKDQGQKNELCWTHGDPQSRKLSTRKTANQWSAQELWNNSQIPTSKITIYLAHRKCQNLLPSNLI